MDNQSGRDGECTDPTSSCRRPARCNSPEDRRYPTRPMHVLHVVVGRVRRDLRQTRDSTRYRIDVCDGKSMPPSRAAANRCSTVFVEPPMATSRATALSKARRSAMFRGSNGFVVTVVVTARHLDDHPHRHGRTGHAGTSASPKTETVTRQPPGRLASVKQFMELAVNMPEHEPHVGQAERSMSSRSSPPHRIVGRGDHGVDQIQPAGNHTVDRDRTAGLHGPSGDEHGRDVQTHRRQQHARWDLVAVRDTDQRIGAVRVDHVFHRVGDQFRLGSE